MVGPVSRPWRGFCSILATLLHRVKRLTRAYGKLDGAVNPKEEISLGERHGLAARAPDRFGLGAPAGQRRQALEDQLGVGHRHAPDLVARQSGRASGRERVWQYVWVRGGAG